MPSSYKGACDFSDFSLGFFSTEKELKLFIKDPSIMLMLAGIMCIHTDRSDKRVNAFAQKSHPKKLLKLKSWFRLAPNTVIVIVSILSFEEN